MITYMPPAQEECIYLSPITSEEIEEEISKLNSTKATHPFSIPTKSLKMIKGIISTPLEIIFNFSLSKGIVPDCFKLVRVIPMFKNGSQMSLNNYRHPVSLLSVLNRIFEKLMFKRLMNFIGRHGILYNKQFGFRQNHSTLMAILSITDKIQKTIDNSNYIIM